MKITFNTNDVDSYRLFLKVKALPTYSIQGHTATFPDEYANRLGIVRSNQEHRKYAPVEWLFDYQHDIIQMAVNKQRFAMFMDCGLGKTLCYFEWLQYVADVLPRGQSVLLICPLMVVDQTVEEAAKFYGASFDLQRVPSSGLQEWLDCDTEDNRIGITNYEALQKHITPRRLGALACDETSILKSHYGVYGQEVIRIGKGLEWKLAGTGTPAPNDRIEYANHAVFLDQFPTVNAFLARYFVNKGQTQERWVIKPHALEPFYRSLSHWCIFLSDPSVYGWKDNITTIPPIHVHHHHVPLTRAQERLVASKTRSLFAHKIGGITNRTALGGIAKGHHKGDDVETNKPTFIRELVESWPDESTIIWCLYDREQDKIEDQFPDAASIRGATPYEKRKVLIDDFKSGRRKVLISKPKVLGYGLNLQIATRQVFSGLQDSYESFYQAVKRSNRVGSTRPLNVHIPVTDIEEPMVENVLRKAKRINDDTAEQERIFRKVMG